MNHWHNPVINKGYQQKLYDVFKKNKFHMQLQVKVEAKVQKCLVSFTVIHSTYVFTDVFNRTQSM